MAECKMSHPGTGRLFRNWEFKVSFQGPEEFSDMGECEKDLWVAGKMSRYQQRDYLSLVMEFSDEKPKQKAFFTVYTRILACGGLNDTEEDADNFGQF
jgi:hypothetical protein